MSGKSTAAWTKNWFRRLFLNECKQTQPKSIYLNRSHLSANAPASRDHIMLTTLYTSSGAFGASLSTYLSSLWVILSAEAVLTAADWYHSDITKLLISSDFPKDVAATILWHMRSEFTCLSAQLFTDFLLVSGFVLRSGQRWTIIFNSKPNWIFGLIR